MSSVTDTLDHGRRAFGRCAWREAYVALSAADRETALAAEDLESLATAAHLTGRDAESLELWTRTHHAYQQAGDVERAARSAFWLAADLLNRGEIAQASGWISRGRRLLGEASGSAAQGYLQFLSGLQSFGAGDMGQAFTAFGQCLATGERFGEPDLVALGRHGQGRVLIRQGASAEGIGLLDEVMVAVTVGDLSHLVVGDIYCSVISACHEIFDLRRAREWTAALTRWCASQPDLVPYRGQCLVRRAEILQLQGAWRDALDEARRACACLTQPPGQTGAGAAFYREGELHRLQGELEQAEEAYREASRLGRKPQPGLALLRLAQGQTEAAAGIIRAALAETAERRNRPALLAAAVEILLASGDRAAARSAAEELSVLSREMEAPFLAATDAHANGAVLLAEGDTQSALRTLRQAWTIWSNLDAPYDAARSGVLIGLACRVLGDEDTAAMELASARTCFERLGAEPDLQAMARMEPAGRAGGGGAGKLTAREVQVLCHLATGKTNRSIAVELGISEKTVARHLSNIYTKLGLSTRVAATAYAFKHDLL